MKIFMAAVLLFTLAGCQSLSERATNGGGSQLELRQIQTKEYSSITKTQALRASIATLQDLGFVIDKADYMLGSVTGTKLSHGVIKITIIVRNRGDVVVVRANARQGKNSISQPEVYQSFFSALGKSIFLIKNGLN